MPHFLHWTLQRPTAISKAIVGSFTGVRKTELAVITGNALSLYSVSSEGTLSLLSQADVFGILRNIEAFRLTGGHKDHIAATSDSGRISVLDWNEKEGKFIKLHLETFGKTGVRRVVAGHYLSVDPKGRCLIIGAPERQKFVYILNRDVSGRMQIGSPLEAHKSSHLCFDLCFLDVGYENPVFVSLETNYESVDAAAKPKAGPAKLPTKHLAFWEMDLGLNNVVKKCTLSCDNSAYAVIPVPAGADFSEGPGGVLVCCNSVIHFRKPDHPDVSVALPRRLEVDENKPIMVTAWTTHRMKDFYFVLVQTEYGDLYRIEIVNEGAEVKELICRYLDTIPVASSLCILKSGFLFAASESTDHTLYQFTGIGSETEIAACSSNHPDGKKAIVPFKPRRLANLRDVATIPSSAPMCDLKVIDCVGDIQTPQLYTLGGSGPRGYLSITRQGIAIEEIAASEVPGYPTGLWTLRQKYDDPFHSHILLSFASLTLVLKITDSIEEQTNPHFSTEKATLHADCLADNSHLQVTEDGWKLLEYIEGSEDRKVTEWRAPVGRKVLTACSNATQVVLGLSRGLLVYFDMQLSGVLTEVGTHQLGHETTAVFLPPTPPGSLRASYVAVGGIDRSIRTLSLEKEKGLFRQVSIHWAPQDAHIQSLCICALPRSLLGGVDPEGQIAYTLLVGLSTGLLLRIPIDLKAGQMKATGMKKQKLLGGTPVRIQPVNVPVTADLEQKPGAFCLSSKPWIVYPQNGRCRISQLVFDQIDFAAALNSVHCAAGFVAICGNILKIIRGNFHEETLFSETKVPLQYTPRKTTVFPPAPTLAERREAQLKNMPIMLLPPSSARPWMLATIEADHNAFDLDTKEKISTALAEVQIEGAEVDAEPPTERQIGALQAGAGKWGGCLRLINPVTANIEQTIAFGVDEAPTCLAVCQFVEYPEHPSLVVGTVSGLDLKTRKCLKGALKVYVYDKEGQLSLHHETPMEDVPLALCAWSGRLLASVGNKIRIYTLGKKRLLKRCEYKNLPVGVNWLRVSGNRVFASDIREGFHSLKYNVQDNTFSVACDMTVPRYITCGEILDPYTLAGGDKFNNLTVVRLPKEVITDVEEVDTTSLKVRGDTTYITGQTKKVSPKP